MKKLLCYSFALLFALLFIVSCKKEQDSNSTTPVTASTERTYVDAGYDPHEQLIVTGYDEENFSWDVLLNRYSGFSAIDGLITYNSWEVDTNKIFQMRADNIDDKKSLVFIPIYVSSEQYYIVIKTNDEEVIEYRFAQIVGDATIDEEWSGVINYYDDEFQFVEQIAIEDGVWVPDPERYNSWYDCVGGQAGMWYNVIGFVVCPECTLLGMGLACLWW